MHSFYRDLKIRAINSAHHPIMERAVNIFVTVPTMLFAIMLLGIAFAMQDGWDSIAISLVMLVTLALDVPRSVHALEMLNVTLRMDRYAFLQINFFK